jgi:hypothetical protein
VNNSTIQAMNAGGGIKIDNYQTVGNLSDQDRLKLLKSMLSFFSLEKLVVSGFTTIEYNSLGLTAYFQD